MDSETRLASCYRHPDRETRLSCTRCDRPICTECLTPAPVGHRCPECAAAERQPAARRVTQSSNPVTVTILAVCVAVYVLSYVPELGALLYFYGVQANEFVAQGEWWRLITAAFLHARDWIAHILFNMWALWVLGPQLERQAGSVAFAALYLASAVAGGAAYFLTVPGGFAVGASGAIFGLFGAWLVASYRSRHTLAGQASFRQMAFLLAINLALPLLVPGIAWQAHLGGLAAGAAITAMWSAAPVRRMARQTVRTAIAALVLLAAMAVVIVA